MRFMVTEYFTKSPMLLFPLLALALFMLVFVLVTVVAFATDKSRHDRAASLPLADGLEEEVRHA